MATKRIKLSKQVTPFTIVGCLLKVTLKSNGQLKILHMQTADGDMDIHLTRSLRQEQRSASLTKGTNLTLSGRRINHQLTGRIKYKAETLQAEVKTEVKAEAAIGATTILICRKCQGKSVCTALATELADRDLDGHVKVEFTGCLKRCDSAPNLVVVKNHEKSRKTKTHHSNVKRQQIPGLLDRHGLAKHPVPVSS
jgi:(2Fe-2S) ferredoxin